MNPSVWITKRRGKKGVSHVVRWIEPETGKNPQRTFRTLALARDFAADLRKKLASNEYQPSVKISYGEWVKRHLAYMESSPEIDVAAKTIAGHGEALDALGRACKPKDPSSIAPRMIREFQRMQLKKGLTAGTVNKHIAAIRSALSYAVRAGVLPANKLLGPHRLMLREPSKTVRNLEVGEVTALMNVTTDLRHKTAISLAYYHGLRRGEICRLRGDDVDLQERRLKIVDRPDGHTKNRASRSIALRDETALLLAKLVRHSPNEYVFDEPETLFWSFDKWFKRLVDAAGLDHCTLHDLRKTCNTAMKEAGVPEEAAMQVLGHESPMVNRRHYTAPLTKQQRLAVDSIPSVG